jgi:RNA polymerase sigma-B factor
MRFIDGLTQSEIATEIGVSQMHVSRLLASSLEKLRISIGTAPQD